MVVSLSEMTECFSIVHWNCNGIDKKAEALGQFLEKKKPEIVALNEVKLDQERANYRLRFAGYSMILKARKSNPNQGGGVALLIRNDLDYSVNDLKFSQLEIICIKVKVGNLFINVVTYYNSQKLNIELFKYLDKLEIDYILIGDLNARSKQFGCVGMNENGKILEDILVECNSVMLYNNKPTYFKIKLGEIYEEILDYCLCSPFLAAKVAQIDVVESSYLQSDHLPLVVELKLNKGPKISEKRVSKYNFQEADWVLYKETFNEIVKSTSDENLENMNVSQLNDFLLKSIYQASISTIPIRSDFKSSKKLPKEIITLIKERKYIKNQIFRKGKIELKPQYNNLTYQLRNEILKIRNDKWNKLLVKIDKNHVSSKLFWKEINSHKKAQASKKIPTLFANEREHSTDAEKCELFGEILGNTFSENGDGFDEKVKIEIEKEVELWVAKDDFKEISMPEMRDVIGKLKEQSAPGKDCIHNVMIKNLPENGYKILLKLANKSFKNGELAKKWKGAQITMIPKKTFFSRDPSEYRPISLTSCVGKLLEKIMKQRMVHFMEENKLIIKQQAGFRKNRSTADNLFFLTQKGTESLDKGKCCLNVYFDIAKAFDKVWHAGVIHKMVKMKFPNYIIKWVIDFLKERSFHVKINGERSNEKEIFTGVPQGGVISPILFSIFINDIPIKNTSQSHSLLFADDLVSINIYNKPGKIRKVINDYLKEIERWLVKWRLKMSANKCFYSIISNKSKQDKLFKLQLFGEKIPYSKNPAFLGMVLDERLTFKNHIERIKSRTFSRLNIIKILSSRYWKLSSNTLKSIYYALVRSILDYMFFAINSMSQNQLNILQRIQNRAVKSIFKPPLNKRLADVEVKNDIKSIRARLSELNDRYVLKCIQNKHETNYELILDYKKNNMSRSFRKETPLCNLKDLLEFID